MRKSILLLSLIFSGAFFCFAKDASKVDSSSLKGKIMCGYQGWFRTPNDGSKMGWNHFSRIRNEIHSSSLVIDMWQDVSEFDKSDWVAVPNLKKADGTQAYVVSSHNPKVIDKHFEWMAQYDIDGVWLQHFLVGFKDGKDALGYESRRQNMRYVRDAAKKYGRVWCISFDTAGVPSKEIPQKIIDEWKRIVEEGLTGGDDYLREGGLPVVQIWGLFFDASHNHLEPKEALELANFFAETGKYSATLVMGGSWNWSEKAAPDWKNAYASFKYFVPWNIGNFAKRSDGSIGASMSFWKGDKAKAESNGMYWIPTIYPGFSWENLGRTKNSRKSRRKGEFFWEQFYEARKLGVETFYVAMFDEIDEGTAIFKIDPNPPVGCNMQDTEGMPPDWYLQIIKEVKRIIKSGETFPEKISISPKD